MEYCICTKENCNVGVVIWTWASCRKDLGREELKLGLPSKFPSKKFHGIDSERFSSVRGKNVPFAEFRESRNIAYSKVRNAAERKSAKKCFFKVIRVFFFVLEMVWKEFPKIFSFASWYGTKCRVFFSSAKWLGMNSEHFYLPLNGLGLNSEVPIFFSFLRNGSARNGSEWNSERNSPTHPSHRCF